MGKQWDLSFPERWTLTELPLPILWLSQPCLAPCIEGHLWIPFASSSELGENASRIPEPQGVVRSLLVLEPDRGDETEGRRPWGRTTLFTHEEVACEHQRGGLGGSGHCVKQGYPLMNISGVLWSPEFLYFALITVWGNIQGNSYTPCTFIS